MYWVKFSQAFGAFSGELTKNAAKSQTVRAERRARRRCSPFGSACRGAFAAADPSRRARCEPDNSQSCIWKSRRVCWFRALICCCIIIFRDKCSSRVQWLHLVMVCLWVNGMDTAWMEDVVSGILELRFCEQFRLAANVEFAPAGTKTDDFIQILICFSLFLLNRGVLILQWIVSLTNRHLRKLCSPFFISGTSLFWFI